MTSDATAVFAPAKINLTLHVTGQRTDGFHLLDSLVAFADIGDRLWFAPSDQLSLTVTGPFAKGVPVDARNLVWKAAELVGAQHQITLEKNLPHGAGIGGGSSDAAAVLRHFGTVTGAAVLGSDVPVCLQTAVQRMQNVGEVLTPLAPLPPIFAVLANPGIHLSTPQVFKALAEKQNPPMPDVIPNFAAADDLIRWLADMRNDLQGPAVSAVPVISDVLRELSETSGACLTRMSGSGATCFALFQSNDAAQSAALALSKKHPDWWVRACRLS